MSKDPKTIGPYQIREVLGEGWRASVYRAYHPEEDREVALKFYRRNAGDRKRLKKWIKELKQLRKLSPSGTEVIVDLGEQAGRPYVARELSPGARSVAELLKENDGRLPQRRAVEIVALVAESLYRLHSAGIYHRNLKPENVLVHKDGTSAIEVELVDVGLPVKVLSKDADEAFEHGADPAYTPPELFNNEDEVDARVDIWGAGALLWRLIAGEPPFHDETFAKIMARIQSGNPGDVPPGTHSDIEAFCEKCLQHDPEARYRSALQLSRDLRRHLAHRPISARPVKISERVGLMVRRVWPQALAIVGILLAVLFLLTILGVLTSG